jgi:hypothetical protein
LSVETKRILEEGLGTVEKKARKRFGTVEKELGHLDTIVSTAQQREAKNILTVVPAQRFTPTEFHRLLIDVKKELAKSLKEELVMFTSDRLSLSITIQDDTRRRTIDAQIQPLLKKVGLKTTATTLEHTALLRAPAHCAYMAMKSVLVEHECWPMPPHQKITTNFPLDGTLPRWSISIGPEVVVAAVTEKDKTEVAILNQVRAGAITIEGRELQEAIEERFSFKLTNFPLETSTLPCPAGASLLPAPSFRDGKGKEKGKGKGKDKDKDKEIDKHGKGKNGKNKK